MDFGALQCTPRNPDCISCPLNSGCQAFVSGDPSEIPKRKKKPARKTRYFHYLLAIAGDQCLLKKRRSGIWRGLFELPKIETSSMLPPSDDAWLGLFGECGLSHVNNAPGDFIASYKQDLSHQRIHSRFYQIKTAKLSVNGGDHHLVELQNLSNFALPKTIDWFFRTQSDIFS